jgi:hypothetical protein
MPRARRWTDEQLIEAVAASRTLAEVSRRLGLRPGKYDLLRGHIARLGIEASHLPRASAGSPRTGRRYTDDDLVAAVRAEQTVHGVLRRLGYTPNGGMFRAIKGHIRALGLDTSHFTGQAWARGTARPRESAPLEEILVRGSTYPSSRLRKRLIRAGLKTARCEGCGVHEWRGKPLPLELDHINGDHSDNRIENLRILCPNCHAITETWAGRNRKRPSRRTPTGRETALRTPTVRVRIPPPALSP